MRSVGEPIEEELYGPQRSEVTERYRPEWTLAQKQAPGRLCLCLLCGHNIVFRNESQFLFIDPRMFQLNENFSTENAYGRCEMPKMPQNTKETRQPRTLTIATIIGGPMTLAEYAPPFISELALPRSCRVNQLAKK